MKVLIFFSIFYKLFDSFKKFFFEYNEIRISTNLKDIIINEFILFLQGSRIHELEINLYDGYRPLDVPLFYEYLRIQKYFVSFHYYISNGMNLNGI